MTDPLRDRLNNCDSNEIGRWKDELAAEAG
jgi:hypothetical protein